MRKLALLAFLAALPLIAQMTAFNKDLLIKYTARNPYGRFEDGRPKAPWTGRSRSVTLAAADASSGSG